MFFRKNRRTESDFSSTTASTSRSRKSTSSLTWAISKTRTSGNDGVDDPKGPLGLVPLHVPLEPQIDFIFVHGLGGGSRKTWSKTTSLTHFWPQEWLPKDPAFKNVRIHSYGYDSDYSKGKDDCLNIHHFGKSFLGEMSTSPNLAKPETQIVVIGHSMGGLVIKKAYTLAKQDPTYSALANRFVAFYFLATPHRGADSARILRSILKVAYDRAYVADLEPNSGAIQVISDEFRHFSADISLWSFYETQNMKLFSSLVVDPESATLGYPGERQMPMTADHRSICKFETQFDPNFIVLRNSLASTVSNISKSTAELELRGQRDQIKNLKKNLKVSEIFDDDFLASKEARMSGSCEWFSTKDSYAKWRDGSLDNERILWIKGKPATGKSVLAGYVIHQLQKSNQDCSYFFFKHGDKSKSRLSACLRSLAFQMACLNAEARKELAEMQSNGIRLEHNDERALWRILFLSNIFRTMTTQHYWVIDALDECANVSFFFDAMLMKLDKSVPLRIFITSRDNPDLDRRFSGLVTHQLQSVAITVADTLPDIKLLAEAKAESLTVVDKEDRALLVEEIVSKSRGSFLWTVLVLNELLGSHSKIEITRVLGDVPKGMEPLYKRALELISRVTRGKELARAVLAWTACAVRPMTVDELAGALQLDIEDVFPRLKESISALCGQLVTVDNLGKVHMVHETAREFLLNDNLDSEFAINKTKAHTRMALVCLTFLVGEEMKPPRTSRRRLNVGTPGKRSPFSLYACTAYSYHLSKADPLSSDVFLLVEKFLKSNILSWIEVIAESQNLGPLIRASKNLRTYLKVCSVERSPLDPRIRDLRGWAIELVRIVAKFGDALITAPSAIYSLIPPFCPTGSMIYNTSSQGRRLAVLGASNEHWDDRLSCFDFRQGQTSTLCYGDEFLAIGLTTGTVALYHTTSYQEYKVLDHGEAVKFIRFNNKTELMATCGLRMIKLWDVRNGEVVHSFQSPQRPLDIAFSKNMLLLASHKNYMASWNLGNKGLQEADRPWSNSSEQTDSPLRRQPCALTISGSHEMLAVAYSGQPITLWDLAEDAYFGSCGKKLSGGETSTHVVVALEFNPNPNIGLLAASYLDGDLALIDPFTDQQIECFRANCHTLTASLDGRLLATGTAGGIFHVYEFDTLRLLYRVRSSNMFIKQLCFTKDNLHIADIRGSQCNVWEPAALLRGSLDDDSSDSTLASIVDTVSLDPKVKITAILVHPTREVIFCGKDDGAVVLYYRKTAASFRTLYRHKSPVRLLAWWQQGGVIMSVDISNRIFAYRVQKSADKGWLADETMVFQSRLESEKAIVDVLVGEAAAKFVVSTRESDHLWTLDGQQETERARQDRPGVQKWILHPKSSKHMICFDNDDARIYRWSDWSEVASISMSMDSTVACMQPKCLTLYQSDQGQRILLEMSERDGSTGTSGLLVLDASSLSAENDNNSPEQYQCPHTAEERSPGTTVKRKGIVTTSKNATLLNTQMTTLALSVAHVIGVSDSSKLVFLDHSSWVCSADLGKDGLGLADGSSPSPSLEYFRHFFLPYDWFAGSRDIVCALAQSDVLFARSGSIAVVRGWLDYTERVVVG